MINSITSVWTAIMTWISDSLGSVQELFYNTTDSTLTFLGTLSVIGVAIGVIFLLIGVIQNFLHLRG